MTTWLIDPLCLRDIQLEVSQKLPQKLVCGSQALTVTLLCAVGSSLYSDTACEVPKCPIAHPPIIGNVIIVEPL